MWAVKNISLCPKTFHSKHIHQINSRATRFKLRRRYCQTVCYRQYEVGRNGKYIVCEKYMVFCSKRNGFTGSRNPFRVVSADNLGADCFIVNRKSMSRSRGFKWYHEYFWRVPSPEWCSWQPTRNTWVSRVATYVPRRHITTACGRRACVRIRREFESILRISWAAFRTTMTSNKIYVSLLAGVSVQFVWCLAIFSVFPIRFRDMNRRQWLRELH